MPYTCGQTQSFRSDMAIGTNRSSPSIFVRLKLVDLTRIDRAINDAIAQDGPDGPGSSTHNAMATRWCSTTAST